jgi:hypothetical protein
LLEQYESQKAEVAEAERAIREMEQRLGELSSDVAANPGDLMDPSRLQKRDAEKFRLQKELVDVKKNLESARKGLADFEEKARQQGISLQP